LIAVYICLAAMYGWYGEKAKAVYWLGAAVVTLGVTMK